jgi:hypothetical protein
MPLWKDQLPLLDPTPYYVNAYYELPPLVTMDSYYRFSGSPEMFTPDLFSIAEIDSLARSGKFQEALSLVDPGKLGQYTVDALGIIAIHLKKSEEVDKQVNRLTNGIKQ